MGTLRVLRREVWEAWWVEIRELRRRCCHWRWCRSLVLSWTSSNRNISKRSSFSPVPSASLAKVSWLCETVVVIVTKLGVGWVTSWTVQLLLRPWFSLYHRPSTWIRCHLVHGLYRFNILQTLESDNKRRSITIEYKEIRAMKSWNLIKRWSMRDNKSVDQKRKGKRENS